MTVRMRYGIQAVAMPRLVDRSVASFCRSNQIDLIEWLYPNLMHEEGTIERFNPTMIFGMASGDSLLAKGVELEIPAFMMNEEEERLFGA